MDLPDYEDSWPSGGIRSLQQKLQLTVNRQGKWSEINSPQNPEWGDVQDQDQGQGAQDGPLERSWILGDA